MSGAVLLLFVSLAAVVFFADHLAHSIQIDAITKRAEQGTLAVVRASASAVEVSAPDRPRVRRFRPRLTIRTRRYRRSTT